MAQTVALSATAREKTGKGAARQARFQKQVPAVIYGHGRATQPLMVDALSLEKALTGIEPESTLIDLTVDGKKARALIREIQRHPLRPDIIHVDFYEIKADEKVTLKVPVHLVGTPDGVRNAGRLVKEGGAHAIKLEGAQFDLVHRLVDIGIPVMAHVGLTPQSVYGLGGYRVQGRGEAAAKVLDQAHSLEKAGAFSIVLEAMPADLGAEIAKELQIPTIGIGAGSGTDAQVLVINDLLGLNETVPKFAKRYVDLRQTITTAVEGFVADVEAGTFPDEEHVYS